MMNASAVVQSFSMNVSPKVDLPHSSRFFTIKLARYFG